MTWNLVDALSKAGEPRAFSLPLASIPPGSTTMRPVDQGQFTPDPPPGGYPEVLPDDWVLNIHIDPPYGGSFSNEGTFPDPAIRLHAIAPGAVNFKPADSEMGNRLILRMSVFLSIRESSVPWWGRWIDTTSFPADIIYENVDVGELKGLLSTLSPSTVPGRMRVPLGDGADFDHDAFVSDFLAGTAFLEAQAGTVIGTAATDPSKPGARLLKLRVRYYDYKAKDPSNPYPHVMNPLELLYLLFGNDSPEARDHPLLLQINSIGMAQPGHESFTMRLRPPLRTHGRLMWESNVEISKPTNANKWIRTADVKTRLCNYHSREKRHFERDYGPCHKCNLFVFDVALRAGFRVPIHPVASNTWHYVDPQGLNRFIDPIKIDQDRMALQGAILDPPGINPQTWGWKIDGWLHQVQKGASKLKDALTDAMSKEGRCFVLIPWKSIHVLLVESVDDEPELTTPGNGLKKITVTTREAGVGVAERAPNAPFDGATGTGEDHLHMFELHPGQDPDTVRGLRDCNVQI